ncbi:MAG: DUF4302 domain-containing protein [Bacteroidales bacterium]|jgi:hypothetical protein|nr:DUF4302 domain-containing protein [Bacteroidales bacterium]
MKKNIKFIALLFGIILISQSCLFQEKDLFDKSAAERLEVAMTDAQTVLLSSTKGWSMEYFPTSTSGGVTFLIKFDEDKTVTIATVNPYTPAYEEATSEWDIISDTGPVLTFNTYNPVFHLFSDPFGGRGNGLGLEGDYEFVIMNVSDDFIQLKGKKRDTDIRLYRLDENQSWSDYFTPREDMNNFLFSNNMATWFLNFENHMYFLSNGNTHVFTVTSLGENVEKVSQQIPFLITSTGLRLYKPFEVDGKEIQNFKLSDDKNSLVCTNENVNAKIEGPEIVSFFHEAIDSYAKRWTLAVEDNSMSPNVKDAYDRIVQSFSSKKLTLEQISYLYSGKNASNAVYISNTRKTEGFLFFEKEIIDEGVKYTFNGQFDAMENGKIFYNNYDGVSDLINLMSGSFKIEVASSKLNPSKVKLTNISDANIWFTVFLQ